MNNIDLAGVSKMVKNILEDMGLRLYDINYNPVSQTLRIFIDKEREAVTVSACHTASNAISRALDNSEVLNFPYVLEVSSPGMERELKRSEHYLWSLGKLVEIDLGTKKIRGYLRDVHDDGIVVATNAGEEAIGYTKILKAKLVEETLYGKPR